MKDSTPRLVCLDLPKHTVDENLNQYLLDHPNTGLETTMAYKRLLLQTQPYCCFALHRSADTGLYLAATRDKKDVVPIRGEYIGLYGGKRDAGESSLDCIRRECYEEGVVFEKLTLTHLEVDHRGYVIHVYTGCGNITFLKEYKESHRNIEPRWLTKEEILSTGWNVIHNVVF